MPGSCSMCGKKDHSSNKCPDLEAPSLDNLPQFTEEQKKLVEDIFTSKFPIDFDPEDGLRENVRQTLENYVKEKFPGSRLIMFGSSRNGFGLPDSDIDLGLKFKNADNVNHEDIISELGSHLGLNSHLCKVETFDKARVPITRCQHKPSCLQIDITVFNPKVIKNTNLLQLYTQLEPRFQRLGCALKKLAQVCDICSTYKGSLSSYAYIIMTIFFLQQRQNPVLPAIDELDEEIKKDLLSDDGGIDDSKHFEFDHYVDVLKKTWPDYGKNKESIAELWINLLQFYGEKMMSERLTINLSTKKPPRDVGGHEPRLTLVEPFDTMDLTGQVSNKMLRYIKKTFCKARNLFAHEIVENCGNLGENLFDVKLLCDTPPPNRVRRVRDSEKKQDVPEEAKSQPELRQQEEKKNHQTVSKNEPPPQNRVCMVCDSENKQDVHKEAKSQPELRQQEQKKNHQIVTKSQPKQEQRVRKHYRVKLCYQDSRSLLLLDW